MSQLSNFVAFIEADLEVDFIPIAQGALAILAKSPNALGAAAAEAYVLANAPAELLAAESSLINAGFAEVSSKLQSWLSSAQTTLASAPKPT
jgi:hypothetical protein